MTHDLYLSSVVKTLAHGNPRGSLYGILLLLARSTSINSLWVRRFDGFDGIYYLSMNPPSIPLSPSQCLQIIPVSQKDLVNLPTTQFKIMTTLQLTTSLS